MQRNDVTPAPEHPTPPPSALGSDAELQAQRETLRRRLRRANLASVLILTVVVMLATGFVWKARESAVEAERANEEAQRASREAERALQATERAEAELWNSRLNEVRAERYAPRPGALLENRRRLAELVRRPNLTEEQRLALRQEAITHLASMDIVIPAESATNAVLSKLIWDATLSRHFWFATNGSVEIVEHPSGRRVTELRGLPGARPQAAVFSPDGRLAAVRFHGGDVRVWEIDTTNLLIITRCVRVANVSNPLLFSPDSRRLGMFTSKGFTLQEMVKGSTPRVLQEGRAIDAGAFTANGQFFAALPRDNLKVVEIWEVATGVTTQRFEPAFPPNGVEWHPDGRRMAILGSRGQLALWETRPVAGEVAGYPRETVRFIGHLGEIMFISFTPDGSKLLSQSWDTTSRFWDVVSGKEIFRETRVSLDAISASGDRAVGIKADGRQEFICRLEPETAFHTIAAAAGLRTGLGTWLSPDGRLLAVGYTPGVDGIAREISLWDFARRVELARVPGIWAQFSADSQTLYTFAFKGIRRFDVTAETLARMPANWNNGELVYEPEAGSTLNSGEISDDGSSLTVAANDRVLHVDTRTGQATSGFKALAHYVSPSPDGLTIATSFQNQPAALRDARTGKSLLKSSGFARMSCSPDTNWIAQAAHDSLRLFRYPSLEPVFHVPLDLGAIVPPPMAFSPDSRMLAVAHPRTEVRLHEIPSGRVLAVFSPPNPSQIVGGHGIEFSRDGRWLILARDGGDVVSWDLQVVKAELEKLGLNWETPATAVAATPGVMPVASDSTASKPSVLPDHSVVETAAFAAALLTLIGGLFVFAVQRRMLKSYDQVEAVAVDQRRRLDSAQTELLHGQKMRALGTLAAGIAHDFNNLLSVIRLSNQLAAEQTKPTGAAKENVDAIEAAVGQGENIVQSMLGYSRAAADKNTTYHVDAVVNETVAMLGRKFLAGIILKLEIEQDLPSVHGSRSRLEQVLLNLIVNASEAMGGQGTLSLVVRCTNTATGCLLAPRPAPRYIELAVGDSGPGISPDVLPRIFEPFFTTKNLGTRPGTGLGLATVYTMAEQDQLGLAVDTQSGAGTTFRVFVPTDGIPPNDA